MASEGNGTIGSGGRLYQDARKRAGENAEPTPTPEVDHQAPEIPVPWLIQPTEPEPIEPPKPDETVEPTQDRQQLISTALEVAGMGVMSTGFGLWRRPLGVIVAGACLTLAGIAAGLPNSPTQRKPSKPRKKWRLQRVEVDK